jgi:DHA1 family bicyclomycin/chloramphenicol resistance-like MFS transporter
MQSPSSTRGMPLLLALLCATGPLGIDMYLPCFPQMAAELGSTEGAIQLSLMTFFAGLMLGQLAYGPLSDRFGRKPLIVVGMAVFVLGSVGCALAADIGQLLWLRLLAGLGGSIGMVIAFAIIKDVYHGPQIGRMMSMVLAVLGLCPVLAPLAGNALESAFSWRAIFWALAIWGVAVTALMLVALPETRSLQARAGYRLSRTFHTYLDILRDRRFTPPAVSLCVAQAGFFAYLAGSSTVFISHYGFSPTAFSLLFAFNALGVIAAALATPRLHARLGLARTYRLVNTAGFAVMAVLALAMLAGLGHVALVCAGLFLAVALLGVLMPTGSQLSLLHQRKLAGTASALMGSMQFGAGAAISAVTGVLAHLGGIGLVAVMAACAAFGSLMCWWVLPRDEPEAPSQH